MTAAIPQRHVIIERTEPITVSIAEACELLGLCRDTVDRLIADEGFPAVQIGRRKLVPVAAARRWVEARIGVGQ